MEEEIHSFNTITYRGFLLGREDCYNSNPNSVDFKLVFGCPSKLLHSQIFSFLLNPLNLNISQINKYLLTIDCVRDTVISSLGDIKRWSAS